ncbi:MAG: hypothetical protein ACE5F1_19410, partial [Planctomycetota bacterium]
MRFWFLAAALLLPSCLRSARAFGQDELQRLREEAQRESEKGAAPEQAEAPIDLTAFNPRVTVFGDATLAAVSGTLRNEDGDDVGDRFSLRETELDFRADIDPFAKGVAILALAEETPGVFELEAEEVYASFHALPWNLKLEAGRFRTSFGQVNRLHTHDLPQTDRPLAVRNFLGEEGDIQNGLRLEYLVPGMAAPTLRLSYELVNGENDRVLAGPGSDVPAHLGRVAAFFDLGGVSWLELGGSVLGGRAEAGGGTTLLAGADLLFKWRPAERSELRSLVLQVEAFTLDRKLAGQQIHSSGAFGSLLWQQDRRWYLGLRGDWSQFADVDRGDEWALSGWISYYTSEFLRLRLGYEHLESSRQEADDLV